MTASEYMAYWVKREVWKHLEWPKHQERFRKISEFLIGETVADVGCALGHSVFHLNKFYPAKWTGIEFVNWAVFEAMNNFSQFEFIYSRGFDLSSACKGRQFESVVCSEVLEHVKEDGELLTGLLGITEKRLILTTPTIEVSDPGHLRVYDEKGLEKLLGEVKAEIIRHKDFFYVVCDK